MTSDRISPHTYETLESHVYVDLYKVQFFGKQLKIKMRKTLVDLLLLKRKKPFMGLFKYLLHAFNTPLLTSRYR